MSIPGVAIVMGSTSDWEMMKPAVDVLTEFAVPHETKVVSAHRAPELLTSYASGLSKRGVGCVIAGAGGAAHLAGVLAAKTTIPVLGVPIPSEYLKGMDSLLSTVQMPRGIPVATFAIGEAGAANAALFAVAMFAADNSELADKLRNFRKAQAEKISKATLPPTG